jgi:hypothetical protein
MLLRFIANSIPPDAFTQKNREIVKFYREIAKF